MKIKKISIVIPTLNEEKNLKILLKEIKSFFKKRKEFSYEIIVVDGYSQDNTVNIAKKFGAKVLYDNVGKGSALDKGVRASKGDIIITIDADLSHRPIEMSLMIEEIRCGYDIVIGSRFLIGGGTEDMPWYRKLGNKFFVFLINLIWNTKYTDLCYGYRAFKKGVWERLNLKSKRFGIETEISIKAAKKKMKVLEIPSFEKKRKYGKGKLKTFRDGIQIFKTILSELK
jgi:glycosyltransferase involved in cell wall biosynthesis